LRRIIYACLAICLLFTLAATVGCTTIKEPTTPTEQASRSAQEIRGKWIIVTDPETEKNFQIKYWEEKEYSPKDMSSPSIGMSIKNNSDRKLNYRDDKDFFLVVSSLDASKDVLESKGRQLFQEYNHPYLQPKEELLFTYSLFHSDETKYYRIDLRYMPSLPVEIKYIETDYARGKCELVSCEASYSEGNEKWIITLRIKSTSKEAWRVSYGACIKDASGRISYERGGTSILDIRPGEEGTGLVYVPWTVIIQNPAVAEVFVSAPSI